MENSIKREKREQREPKPLDPTTLQLIDEKERIDPSLSFVHSILQDEIERRSGKGEPEFLEVDIPRKIKLMKKILVPSIRNPDFNYIGKLMGPGGSTLKKLQEKLSVKIHVAGRGSSKDIVKEQELLMAGDPKHRHFAEDLHVRVETIAPPAEAFRKVAAALEEIKAHFSTDLDDEISRAQVAELGFNPNSATSHNKNKTPGSATLAAQPHHFDNRRNQRGRNQFGGGPYGNSGPLGGAPPAFSDFNRPPGPPMMRPPFSNAPRGPAPFADYPPQEFSSNNGYNMPPTMGGYNDGGFQQPPLNMPGPMMQQGMMPPPQRAPFAGPRPPMMNHPPPMGGMAGAGGPGGFAMNNQQQNGMQAMMNHHHQPMMGAGGPAGPTAGPGGKWGGPGPNMQQHQQHRGANRPHPYGRVVPHHQGPGGDNMRNMGPY